MHQHGATVFKITGWKKSIRTDGAQAINRLQVFVNDNNADYKVCIISSEASVPLEEKIIEGNLYTCEKSNKNITLRNVLQR
jgi:hypothetical protein